MPQMLSTYYRAFSCSYYCGNPYLFAGKIVQGVTPNDYFLAGAILSPQRCQRGFYFGSLRFDPRTMSGWGSFASVRVCPLSGCCGHEFLRQGRHGPTADIASIARPTTKARSGGGNPTLPCRGQPRWPDAVSDAGTFNVPVARLRHGHGAISWQPKRPYAVRAEESVCPVRLVPAPRQSRHPSKNPLQSRTRREHPIPI
jgi:hypothetical protein